MQESSKVSAPASSIISDLTIEQFLDLHRNNISLDHIYLLSYFKNNPSISLPENERVQAAIQFLVRKAFLTENLVITHSGEALLEGCGKDIERKVFSKLKEAKSSVEELFEQWWKVFPNTDRFEYKGKKFEGYRTFKCKKWDCKKLFIKIVNEGKFTAEDLIQAIKYEVQLKKDESLRRSDNMLRFIRNTHTYLLNETYESYMDAAKAWSDEDPIDNMSI